MPFLWSSICAVFRLQFCESLELYDPLGECAAKEGNTEIIFMGAIKVVYQYIFTEVNSFPAPSPSTNLS